MDIPPLFKQGASARARAGFFALISIIMLVVDSRMHALTMVRQAVGTGLYPFQVVALIPRDAAYKVGDYFNSLNALQKENDALRRQQAMNAQLLQQERQMAAENAQLRNLLNMQQRIHSKSLVGEILYDARDPFTRKIILNRGSQQGVAPGQPVIDDVGIVGQVTRVFPFTSEVTLLTDKDQAIPVQVLRNGLRSVAYGRGQASVLQVETKSTDAFAHIVCLPAAGVDRHKQLLILLVEQTVAPRPDPEGADKADKLLKRRFRDSAKDGEAVPAKDAPSEERKGQAPTAAPAAPAAAAPAATAAAPAAKPAAATPTAPATAKPAAAAATSAAPAATQPAKSTR